MVKVTDDYYIDVNDSPVVYTIKCRKIRRKKGDNEKYEDFEVLGYLTSLSGALEFIGDQIIASTLTGISAELSDGLRLVKEATDSYRQIIKEAMPTIG